MAEIIRENMIVKTRSVAKPSVSFSEVGGVWVGVGKIDESGSVPVGFDCGSGQPREAAFDNEVEVDISEIRNLGSMKLESQTLEQIPYHLPIFKNWIC